MGAPFTTQPHPGDRSLARRLRVLVADDHPINLQYMSILLEKMGHEATFCKDGQEALQWLRQRHFDVVLMDYHMPSLDGMATTEAIRRLDGPASLIKVILVTADVLKETHKRALAVGVNECTSKPVQAQDLQRALIRCGLLDEPMHPTLSVEPLPTGGSPMSACETPVRPPELASQKSDLIDEDLYAEIVSMMPGDSLEELIKKVLSPPEGTVHVLLQALADGDREAIGNSAHKLKGAAMLMGFRALKRTSAELELWATQTEQPLPANICAQLRLDAQQTQQALRRPEQSNTA